MYKPMRNRKPSTKELQALYLRWLQGESLRQIARSIGVRHSTLDVWFDSTFGKKATDPIANSLVRSMLEDYPNEPVVRLWAAGFALRGEYEVVQHRSNHSIRQLTNYQCLHEDGLMDIIATSDIEVDPDEYILQQEAKDGHKRLPLRSLLGLNRPKSGMGKTLRQRFKEASEGGGITCTISQPSLTKTTAGFLRLPLYQLVVEVAFWVLLNKTFIAIADECWSINQDIA